MEVVHFVKQTPTIPSGYYHNGDLHKHHEEAKPIYEELFISASGAG
jgi:hypothetical protein